MKLDLINSKNDRETVMKEENLGKLLNILRKFGNVVDYMTEPMVAQFFDVPNNTIKTLATRNEKELNNYGYRAYKKNEILKFQFETLENIPNRGLRLYPIKAVILIGMMLTESKVAEQLRSEIISELFSVRITEDDLVLTLYHSNDGIERVNCARQLVDLKVAEATKVLEEENERKQRIINDLVYNIPLAEKRQRINQIIKHGSTQIPERWNLLYKELNMKYHMDVNRRAKNEGISKIEYIDRIGMIDELYELCVKLFESDINVLIEQWKNTIEGNK